MNILFMSPDYHCSFIYADKLKEMGHECKIFVPDDYPINLLYNNKNIIFFKSNNRFLKLAWKIKCIFKFSQYDIQIYYGCLDYLNIKIPLFNFDLINLILFFYKILKVKIIYVPSGCNDEELKENFKKFDNGNVCFNCGVSSNCLDQVNKKKFALVNKFSDLNIGLGCYKSNSINLTHLKYKIIDLEKWSPNISIPNYINKFDKNKIIILHSFFDKNRINEGKNEKGSQYVYRAFERLKSEGYNIEYVYLNNIKSSDMRYYQIQADIVVEQLIYGWWGSTGVETMSLGKPVICYLRRSWKEFFFKQFPEYSKLPIIEASPKNIYEVLKELIINPELREKKGKESREFAKSYFNPDKNAKDFLDKILS